MSIMDRSPGGAQPPTWKSNSFTEHWARVSGTLFEHYAELEAKIPSLQETRAYWAARKESQPGTASDKEQEASREITRLRGLQRPIKSHLKHSLSMLLDAAETANPTVFEKMRSAPSTVVRHTMSVFVTNQLAKLVVSKGQADGVVDTQLPAFALAKQLVQDQLPQLNWRNRVLSTRSDGNELG